MFEKKWELLLHLLLLFTVIEFSLCISIPYIGTHKENKKIYIYKRNNKKKSTLQNTVNTVRHF